MIVIQQTVAFYTYNRVPYPICKVKLYSTLCHCLATVDIQGWLCKIFHNIGVDSKVHL